MLKLYFALGGDTVCTLRCRGKQFYITKNSEKPPGKKVFLPILKAISALSIRFALWSTALTEQKLMEKVGLLFEAILSRQKWERLPAFSALMPVTAYILVE